MIVKRWALWSKDLNQFYKEFPKTTEVLFESRSSAIATRLSGSHYSYRPVKVELHHSMERSK